MRLIILLFSLVGLSGCVVGNLQQLSFLDPQANDFPTALSAEYLAYATAEQEQGHGLSAEYFAGKGMNAWHGEAVAPEEVDAGTPSPLKEEMIYTRKLLMALLTEDVKRVVPQQAARAQLLFDCWMKQVARKDETQLCVEELHQTLETLQNVASTLSLTSEETHVLHFAPGSSKLGKAALAKIDQVATKLAGGPPFIIDLEGAMGHDSAGVLLNRRAAEIRRAFESRGIGAAHIRIKEVQNEKTVYLSCDDTIKDENSIAMTISVFGDNHAEEQAQP